MKLKEQRGEPRMWPSVHPGGTLRDGQGGNTLRTPDLTATQPLTEISHQSRLLHRGLPILPPAPQLILGRAEGSLISPSLSLRCTEKPQQPEYSAPATTEQDKPAAWLKHSQLLTPPQ